MIAGHFGFAALAKSRAPGAPLWGLMLASVWLDWVFAPLLAAHVEFVEALHPGYGGLLIHADYTHSIVGALVLAVLLGVAFWPRWGWRSGAAVAVVGFSHWLLDLIVHRPDMPVLPGNAGQLPMLGFGLWTTPLLAASIELALVLVGAFAYWNAARHISNDSAAALRRSNLCAALVAAFGILVLGLDYFS